MGSLERKLQANMDKQVLYQETGKVPKHRCPKCHRFTFWRVSKDGKKKECYWCIETAQKAMLQAARAASAVAKQGIKEKVEKEIEIQIEEGQDSGEVIIPLD